MFYIYILYSASADKYYVGYSNDYRQRLIAHNTSDRLTYTSKHRPWELKAAFEAGEDEGKAIIVEKFIKKQKSRSLIEALVRGEKLHGELAQLVRVPHLRD